jgi:hypothetical protein
MEQLKTRAGCKKAASPKWSQIGNPPMQRSACSDFGKVVASHRKELADELKLNALLPILAVASDLRRKEVQARLNELCGQDEAEFLKFAVAI